MKSNSKASFFLMIILLYCVARFSFVMTTSSSFFSLPIVLIIGLCAVVLCALQNRSISKFFYSSTFVFLILNIFVVVTCFCFVTNSEFKQTNSTYIKQLMILVLLCGIFLILKMKLSKERNVVVGFYILGIAVSAVYTTYVALSGGEMIIRQTAYGVYDSSFKFTYGGFDFIYGLVIIYVAFLTVYHRARKRIRPIHQCIMLVMIIIMAITIILSQYSTAFALILIFTVLELLPRNIFKYLFLILLGVLIYFAPTLITGFISFIPFIPDLTSSRINELILSFSGLGASEYIIGDGQRMDRILWSLKIFAEHPILGGFATNTTLPFGYHTEWIDQLARYGAIATLFSASFWAKMHRHIVSYSPSDVTKACVTNSFIMFVVLGFLDPISMVVTAAPLFILCPFLEEVFLKEKAYKNEYKGENL